MSERVPDIERERPEGNVPEVLLHVYGVAPPVAENVVVYVVLVLIPLVRGEEVVMVGGWLVAVTVGPVYEPGRGGR